MLAQYEILTMCLFTVYNMVENVHFLLDFGSEHMFFPERRRKKRRQESCHFCICVQPLKFMYY